MARKKIREYAAKNLLKRFISQYNPKFDYSKWPLYIVTNDTNFRHLKQTVPNLASDKFVVKPDMLFGTHETLSDFYSIPIVKPILIKSVFIMFCIGKRGMNQRQRPHSGSICESSS